MKISLLLFDSFFIHSVSFAANPLSYQCAVTRTDSNNGTEKICGNLKVSIEQDAPQTFPLCGAQIMGGSAIATKGKAITIALGTLVPANSTKTQTDVASIAFYPESAPKDFVLSFLPNSIHSDSLVAECAMISQ